MMSAEIKKDQAREQAGGSAADSPGGDGGVSPELADEAWRQSMAEQLVQRSREGGMKLVGPDGLLAGITKTVLETALETELSDHLGFGKGDTAGQGAANVRNGHSGKTVQTDLGPVRISVPRDRAGSFEPLVVPKHVRRVGGFNEAIISLYADVILSFRVSQGCDLRRRVVDSVADGSLAAGVRCFMPLDRYVIELR